MLIKPLKSLVFTLAVAICPYQDNRGRDGHDRAQHARSQRSGVTMAWQGAGTHAYFRTDPPSPKVGRYNLPEIDAAYKSLSRTI